MSDTPLHLILNHLRRLAGSPAATGPADGELLDRFARRGDEAAFELLLWRHGALVLGVCRRLLHRPEDVADAFQATFLALVRRAGHVRRDALAGWLYQVAYRVALRAKRQAARRAGRERAAARPEGAAPADELLWRDLRPVLDEEVSRLPERYRRAVVLCYLGGRTTGEAARELGCPKGTVLSRLAWARQRLRERLSRRGVTLSAGLLATLAATEAAGVPPLVQSTVRAAVLFAAGESAAALPSARAVAWSLGVLRAMILSKLKTGAGVVLMVGALGMGLSLWGTRPAVADSPADPAPRPPAAAPAAAAPAAVRPVGTWKRDAAPYHLDIQVEADRLSATLGVADEEAGGAVILRLALEADYSVTRDYVLYGVITSLAGGTDPAENDPTQFIDHPFSVRYRVDGDVLTVKDVKFAGQGMENQQLRMLVGRYHREKPEQREAVKANPAPAPRQPRPAQPPGRLARPRTVPPSAAPDPIFTNTPLPGAVPSAVPAPTPGLPALYPSPPASTPLPTPILPGAPAPTPGAPAPGLPVNPGTAG